MNSKALRYLFQDGTSQAGRSLKALDPEYVQVDERSIGDLLAFARDYSRQLNYFNEQNEQDGDWSGFLGEDDLDAILRYLNDPDRLGREDGENKQRFLRPHFVLFLTFLELLQHARSQLNEFTRRHLEFYYREALRMTTQAGIADHVHVTVELADGQEQFLLPAGTLFQAGQDSQGKDLIYRSEEDLVANQATVESIKSLFAQKQVIGIREAREDPAHFAELFRVWKPILENEALSDKAFMAMLIMALGVPGPGGILDPYPANHTVDPSLLTDLDGLLDFIPSQLYMPVTTFQLLMQLKNDLVLGDQGKQINQQWKTINGILEKAGKNRDDNYKLDPDNKVPDDDFETNFLSALGRSEWGNLFKELPDVETIYDLSRHLDQPDVIAFIGESHNPDGSLKSGPSLFMSVAEFSTMMKEVEDINGRWRQIYEILRAAARKRFKDELNHTFDAPLIRSFAPDKFNVLVQKTLGIITYPKFQGRQLTSFDDCYDVVLNLENYFHMPAEKFVLIRTINAKQKDAQPWEWEQVYAILEEAHESKAVADRQETLKNKHQAKGFDEMIRYALGDPQPGDDLPESRKFLELNSNADKDYITDRLFLEIPNFEYIKATAAKANPTDAEWSRVYAILEQAQRRKRNLVDQPAQVENWENLYAASDATQLQVQFGGDGESVTPRWRTFGDGYSAYEEKHVAPGTIGFAIASPLLALAEGVRTITITLGFGEEGFDAATVDAAMSSSPSPFQFFLSTEKGMTNVNMTLVDPTKDPPSYPRALKFTTKLAQQFPPITPLIDGAGIATPWPILQITLADIIKNGHPQKGYRAFQPLRLEKIQLTVNVTEIANLVLQDDETVLNSKKPFEPFGAFPVGGASFYFAHPELCSKELDELKLKIEWLGVPDDLKAYYMGYKNYDDPKVEVDSPITGSSAFKAQLSLYDHRSFHDVKEIQLFNEKASEPHEETVSHNDITKEDPTYKTDTQPIIAEDVLDWDRYWRVEFPFPDATHPDFQHAIFPHAAAGCAKKLNNQGALDPFIINPPYTPKIKKLSAEYTAGLEIDLIGSSFASGTEQLYHVEPFGYRNLTSYESKPYPFLPQYENEGELFIGIKNLAAPHNLSLLFQLADGSADPDLEPAQIHWTFLNGDQWQSLEQGRLLGDTTNGLLNSGIVKFNLPAASPSTLLPTGLYWIRATIAKHSRSVADTVGVRSQAVQAVFEDHSNPPDHLSQPLAPESISRPVERQPAVRAIHQPYSSFGGKSPEPASRFYQRVSERLRHKDRALTCWDYEHMVLEAFPNIYKVKCLPAGTSEDPSLEDVVQVIVIPDIRGKLPFDPFEPKAPSDVLWQIEQFLSKHSPPFSKLKVKNPSYVRLQVRLIVRFQEDADPGYYKNALNQELQQYLAPWAYDQSAEIVFGNRINESLIINFVEERPYIDYVAGIELFTILDGKKITLYNPPSQDDLEVDFAFAPDAILVSDRSHEIDLISEAEFQEQFFTGIGFMKIEFDFKIPDE